MAKKTRGPDLVAEHLDKVGRQHEFLNYAQGTKYYDLPYWVFVNLAKDAGATVVLHKTAIADRWVIDKYLDENCLVVTEKQKYKESEREIMKRKMDIERVKEQVAGGSKRWGRYDEGAELFFYGASYVPEDRKGC